MAFTCPLCRTPKDDSERFERGSDWCTACVHATVEQQDRLRFAVQRPQVIEYQPES